MNNFKSLKEASSTHQQKKTIFFFWYYNTGYPEGTGRRKWNQYKPNLHVDLLNAFSVETGRNPVGLDISTTFIKEEGGGIIRAKVKLLADVSWIQEIENSDIMNQKSPIVAQQHTNQRNQHTQQSQEISRGHYSDSQERIKLAKDTLSNRITSRNIHIQNRQVDFAKGTRDSFVAQMKMHDIKMHFKDRTNKEIILWNDYERGEGWSSFEPFVNFVSVKLTEVGFSQTRTSSKQKWFEKKPSETATLRMDPRQNRIKLNFFTKELRESNFKLQLEHLKE